MDYVEKMVTSTAETAFLAGAEESSTLMCERLNSALDKVFPVVFLFFFFPSFHFPQFYTFFFSVQTTYIFFQGWKRMHS